MEQFHQQVYLQVLNTFVNNSERQLNQIQLVSDDVKQLLLTQLHQNELTLEKNLIPSR